MKKWMSLLLAVVMLAGLCTAFADEEVPAVALTVDGREITKAEVQQYAQYQLDGGYTDTLDYEAAMEDLILNAIAVNKIAELGLDQYTEEEKEAFRLDAQKEWKDAIDAYVQFYLAEDTEEARAQAEADAIAYYTAYGYSEEALFENALLNNSFTLLQEHMLAGEEITVTEEEIQTTYNTSAENDKLQFEGNIYMYELYQQYYGYESLYTPEGYRGVTHILLDVDETLLSDYQTIRAAAEEEGSEVTVEDVEKARQAVLASRQEDLDAIYGRLENGESFETLIAEFGTDPGMGNPDYLRDGYAVHKESLMYDADFTAGAFSEKMVKVGDVSDPVVSSFGIHILYYLRDLPAGIAQMSDETHVQIEEYLLTTKQNQRINDVMAQWRAAAVVVRNEDVIATFYAVETPAEVETPAAE